MRWVFGDSCCVMMFDGRPGYIIIVVLCDTVGAVHVSRVVCRQGAVGIRRGVYSAVYRIRVGRGRNSFLCFVFFS